MEQGDSESLQSATPIVSGCRTGRFLSAQWTWNPEAADPVQCPGNGNGRAMPDLAWLGKLQQWFSTRGGTGAYSEQVGQWFRLIPATDSGASRPPIPVEVGRPLGPAIG